MQVLRALVAVLCTVVAVDAKRFAAGGNRTAILSSAETLQQGLQNLDFGAYDNDLLRDTVVHFFSPGWPYARRKLKTTKGFDGLAAFFKRLPQLTGTYTCKWDKTLNPGYSLLKHKRIFLAANFKDSEKVLPHLILQIWHMVALFPDKGVFVSIYESGSTDRTGFWLKRLRSLLIALKVPYRIEREGALNHGGSGLRQRTELLSRLRNAALEPLWSDYGVVNPFLGNRSRRSPAAQQKFEATDIVFLNDVYACAGDMIRLLYHDAHVACATDWWWAGHIDSYTFYDIWVANDPGGNRATWGPPFLSEPYAVHRMKAGLTVPMKSCWNGLVSLKASPFMYEGLRFRTSQEGECLASECKLISDDMIALGHTRIIMDAGIRLAYTLKDAKNMYDRTWIDLNITTFADVRAHPLDVLQADTTDRSLCCVEAPNGIDLLWERCAPNQTYYKAIM